MQHFSLRNTVTLWNYSNSHLTTGPSQVITVNGKNLGLLLRTVQTLNKKSTKIVYPKDQVLVTFAPSMVKAGSIVMKINEYPGMAVRFAFSQDEKEIIWEIRGVDDELIEPEFWYNVYDEP